MSETTPYPWLTLINLTGGFPRIVGREKKEVFSDVDVVAWLEETESKKEALISINHVIQTGMPIILSRDYGVEKCNVDRAKDLSKTGFWVCCIWDGDYYHVVLKGTGDGNYVPIPGAMNIRTSMENRLVTDLKELGL